MRFLLVAITLVCADLHFSCLGSKTSGNQVRFYSCYINTYIRQGPIISSSINLFSLPICFGSEKPTSMNTSITSV